MSSTIDTFIYLQRDIEQSFQRIHKLFCLSSIPHNEIEQILNHISCTLDDLQKVNQLLHIPTDKSDNSDEKAQFLPTKQQQQQQQLSVSYSKELTAPSTDERQEYLIQMKSQLDYYQNKIQSSKTDSQMDIIRLDQENEDQLIRQQDEQLEDFHLSIVSLKNLTQNMNFEINDHIRVLDNLETGMTHSQSRVENLTHRTKDLLLSSTDGFVTHTCLFSIAIILFFLIVILVLFF